MSEDENNTSDHSTSFNGDGLLSTNSSENLQMELANCAVTSDGLSDKELTVRKMAQQVSNSPERVFKVGRQFSFGINVLLGERNVNIKSNGLIDTVQSTSVK